MSSSILAISGTSIKQDSFGRFCLNDLHKAAGGEKCYQPANWQRLQQTVDLIKLLESEELKFSPLETVLGKGVPILTGRKRTLRNSDFYNSLISFNNL